MNVLDEIGKANQSIAELNRLLMGVRRASAILPDENVSLDYLGAATYRNLHQFINNTCSAMLISGGAVTPSGANEIDVAAGIGILKTSDSGIGENVQFDWSAEADIAIAADETTWIGIEYNAGSPRVKTDIALSNFNLHTDFILARAYNDGGTVCVLNAGSYYTNFQSKVCYRFFEVEGMARVSGAMIADAGNLDFSLTEGRFYCGVTPFTTAAWDCSGADRFTYWYRDGIGGWTTAGVQADIDPLKYDDGDGVLGNLGAGRYGVHWVYVCHDNNVHVQYGQGNYKHFEAEDALVPTPPDFFVYNAKLVGKIIVGQGAAVLEHVESAFVEVFTGAGASIHNDLAGLQGGQAAQYYHLNAAEHGYVSGVNAQSVLTTAEPGFVSVRLLDTGSDHYLKLRCNENLSAARILSFVTGDASRTITLGGNPTLQDWFNQSVKTTASPTFVTAKLSALTDGYLPYHVSDAAGLANSGIFWDNGNSRVGIGTVIPAATLTVQKSNAAGIGGEIIIDNLGGGYGTESALSFYHGSLKAQINTVLTTDAQGSGNMIFSTHNPAGVFGERMRIASDGKVGVGCTPGTQFEVAGIGTFQGVNLGSTFFIEEIATNDPRMAINIRSDGTPTGGGFEFYDYGGEAWSLGIVQKSGNVGIGRVPSLTRFHVTTAVSWLTTAIFENTNDDASPGMMWFHKNPVSGGAAMAINDYIGGMIFRGIDGAGNAHSYAEIWCQTTGVAHGSEGSKVMINTWEGGVEYANNLVIRGGKVGVGTGTPTLAYGVQVSHTNPQFSWLESPASLNNKTWDFMAVGEVFYGRTVNDAYTDAANWLIVNRTALVVDSVSFPGSAVLIPNMRAGINQGAAGAAAGELWRDTDDDNTVKLGV